MNFKRPLIFFLCFIFALPALAQEEEADPHAALWAVIKARPDAQLKTVEGIEMVKLQGDVVCGLIDNEVKCEDRSGFGAFGCAWQRHVELLSNLKVCYMREFGALLPDMDYASEKMSAFLMKNSFMPTTQEQIDTLLAERLAYYKTETNNGFEESCNVFAARPVLEAMSAQTSLQRRAEIDDLVYRARPVVNEPCE